MHRILRHISSACLALALLLASAVLVSAQATANDAYLTLGPSDDAKAAEVTKLLDAEDISFATRPHQARESLGFIVVTERLPSFAEGQDLILELEAEQIGDLLYVKVGDYAKRVSASVYSTESAARRRAESLQDRGFDFSVIERSRGITKTIVDITTEPDESLQQRLKLLISDPAHYQKVDSMSERAEPVPPVSPSLYTEAETDIAQEDTRSEAERPTNVPHLLPELSQQKQRVPSNPCQKSSAHPKKMA